MKNHIFSNFEKNKLLFSKIFYSAIENEIFVENINFFLQHFDSNDNMSLNHMFFFNLKV